MLEPNEHPATKKYQKKLFADGIPVNMFGGADIFMFGGWSVVYGDDFSGDLYGNLTKYKEGEVKVVVYSTI